MSDSVRQSIYEEIASIRLIDPHTHINPHAPASSTLADLLGYHYYTELAHSAGMPREQIEAQGIGPRELVRRLVANLQPLENTAQYRWLIEICRVFFGFEEDRIDASNWEHVYDLAEARMSLAQWPQMVLDQSNVEAVFLTNDFDDPLEGFDSSVFIPCLRTDDLVFHLAKDETRQRLAACTGLELDGSLTSLRQSLRQRFDHFVTNGARACAISLPPTFAPQPVSDGRAESALNHILRNGSASDASHLAALSRRVFWTLAELCDEFGLPFDLMIGVNRGVYPAGVHQGQDLYDSRVSLIQYQELFNAFPNVKFPISVLASVTNQELVSYAWIFPNVITNGHWWYSNTPSFIARDAAARLEAVPQTKQIGYYSDAYKLEFVWPKFDMYRHVLAGILAENFVEQCGWSEERAIDLGRRILRENVDAVFPAPGDSRLTQADTQDETWVENPADDTDARPVDPAAATSAALAAGAIGMVEVVDDPESESIHNYDSMPTTFDDPGSTETVRIETAEPLETSALDHGADEESADADCLDDDLMGDAAESLTSSEADDTVRISERSHDHADGESDEEPLDPLPTEDEIQAVDLNDVEWVDDATEAGDLTVEQIDSIAEPEPLDVGDIWDEPDRGDEDDAEEELLGTINLDEDDAESDIDFELVEEPDDPDDPPEQT